MSKRSSGIGGFGFILELMRQCMLNHFARVSILLYAIAVPVAFVVQWVAGALYILVALMWLIPDRRIERAMTEKLEIDG